MATAVLFVGAALSLTVPHAPPPLRSYNRHMPVKLSLFDAEAASVNLQTSFAEERRLLEGRLMRDALKLQLLRVCAACNRGFGASALDRANVDSLLNKLSELNPCVDATAGVAGSEQAERWVGRGLENADWADGTVADGPLEGVWRLVYTNATDVLSLDVNPIAGVGPICQEIRLPDSVVNVITLYPRALGLLPAGVGATSTVLRVGTRARARSSTRVGLTFERVGVEARDFLGVDLSKILPQLSLPLPRVPGSNAAGADSDTSPAFFDVAYVDAELLFIVQNQPGGCFVLVRETAEELQMRDRLMNGI